MAIVIFPIYLLSCMNSLSFLIPADSGERISLLMTIQLGVVFSVTLVEAKTAPSGTFPAPKIFWFVYYVLGTGLFSLVVVIWRNYVTEKRREKKIHDVKMSSFNKPDRAATDKIDFGLFLVSIFVTVFYIIGLQVTMIRLGMSRGSAVRNQMRKNVQPHGLGTHQFDLFCTSTIFISSTFSVLRPLYFDRSTSTALLRPLYFELFTSTSVLRPRNLDFLLVEKFGQKDRSKV